MATSSGRDRTELADGRVPGLSLRVSGAGAKSWVIRYRTPDHRQMRVTLGKYPAVSLHDARALAMDMLLAVAHGGDPATIAFCHRIGLDYVSCSPYRVPVARLAAAQAALASAD